MDQVVNSTAPAVAESVPAPVVNEPSMADTMASVFDKLNPQERVERAENGTFESKNPPAEGAESDTPTNTQEPAQAQLEPAKVEAPKPAIEPPVSWTAEMKGKWASLPPEAQEFIAKRETDAHKQISELGRTAKAYEPIRGVIEQFSATLQKTGLPPADAFARMLAVNDMLEQSPETAIGEIAKAYGVDLSRLAGSTPSTDGNAEITALKQTVAQLQRQLSETSTRVQTREQREAEERTNTLAKTIDDFAKGKDYWADIEPDILAQIHAIKASDPDWASHPDKVLQKAHDNALKLNEAVANKLNEAKRKEDEAKAEAEKKRKAEEAKRLSSLNVKPGNGASPKAKGSWEDTMREVGSRLMAS